MPHSARRIAFAALIAAGLLAAAPASAQMAACSSAARKDSLDDQLRLYTICLEGGLGKKNRAGAYNNRGVVHMRMGQMDEALSDFSRSITNDPKWGMAYLNRARIYASRGEREAALADLDQAVRRPPSRMRADAHALRGDLKAQDGAWADALADYEEALDYDKRHVSALLSKAWLLSAGPDETLWDAEAGLDAAQRAVKEEDSAVARDILALAYAANGRFEDAAREQERAIAKRVAEGLAVSAEDEETLEIYRNGGGPAR